MTEEEDLIMIPDAPSIHRANFIRLLENEIQAIWEDEESSQPEAYARLVLKTLGYEFIKEQYSDGSREYGIDYWDSSDESSEIFQFKSTDFSRGIDDSRKVTPGHLTDLPRIQATLIKVDEELPSANASVRNFLERLRYNIKRYYDSPVKHDQPYEVSINLAVLASSFTEQAQNEFDRQCEETLIHLKNGNLKLKYNSILIDDLVNEKWRSINTEWKDINNTKRNFIEVTVCDDKLIDLPKSLVFFTKAIDLVDAFKSFGYQIFEPNVRCEVPKSKVNDKIKASISSYSGRKEFRHLNNGVTMICANYKKPNRPGQKIKITEPGIINGLQTVKSIADEYKKLDSSEKADFDHNCSVLLRLHMRNAVDDYRDLVKSTNNQNKMEPRNYHSNDAEQVAFERIFADMKWFYERKQGAWRAFMSDPRLWKTLSHRKVSDFQIATRRFRTIDNEDLAQCWLAFLGFSNEAVHNRKEIFEKDEIYEFLFLSRPNKHGADQDFDFRPNELGTREAPPPDLMLASWFFRESVQKLVLTARANRDEACRRLKIEEKTREDQDKELVKDRQYLRNLILRAWSLLFPEFVGFILFQAFGDQIYSKGKHLLLNHSLKSLYEEMDFDRLTEIIRTEQYDKNDFLVVMWHLFVRCADQLVHSPWLDSWKQAKTRTRFNYSVETRKRLIDELVETDRFLSQDNPITRTWAVGLNNSKGVFSFTRDVLIKKGK